VTQQQHAMTYPIAQLERRFTAFAIDRLLAWGLLALVGVLTVLLVSDDVWTVVGVVGGTMVLLWLVLAVVLGATGTSPGKAATGLRVVHHGTGTPIGVGPALLRSLVLGAAGVPTFGVGVATLAWTAVEDRGRQRRGWHDHLTHTVVVDVRPVAEVADQSVDEGPRHIVNLTAMRLIPAPPVEVRTPERSEHSMRRQQLPPEVLREEARRLLRRGSCRSVCGRSAHGFRVHAEPPRYGAAALRLFCAYSASGCAAIVAASAGNDVSLAARSKRHLRTTRAAGWSRFVASSTPPATIRCHPAQRIGCRFVSRRIRPRRTAAV